MTVLDSRPDYTADVPFRLTKNTITLFWSHVEKSDGCWIWTAGVDHGGYGQASVGHNRTSAHRISYFIHTNHWPTISVLHTCDNPPCVRPDHLFLGTQADNLKDMAKKGRHGRAKLTRDDVELIRAMYFDQEVRPRHTQTELAAAFGVSQQTIHYAVHGVYVWSHVK